MGIKGKNKRTVKFSLQNFSGKIFNYMIKHAEILSLIQIKQYIHIKQTLINDIFILTEKILA